MSSKPRRRPAIYAALGELAVKWNQVELTARSIINYYYRLGDEGEILVAHMGNVTLADALNTLTAEFAEPEEQPYLSHFVTYVDAIRSYRNYYIHGVINADGDAGMIQQIQAKGRLTAAAERVSVAQVREVILMCERAATYGAIMVVLSVTRGGPDYAETLESASRHKPPLPPTLRKPRRYLLERESPPRPSPK